MNSRTIRKIALGFFIILSVLIFSFVIYYILLSVSEKQTLNHIIKESLSPANDLYLVVSPTTVEGRVFSPSSEPSPIFVVTEKSNSTPNKDPSGEVISFPLNGKSHILLLPDNYAFRNNEIKLFTLLLVPDSSQSENTLDYIKTEIQYNILDLHIAENRIIDTSSSGLGRLLKVGTPSNANTKGILTIELGSFAPSSGPTLTSPLKIATIPFQTITSQKKQGKIIVGKTQAVGNDSKSLSIITQETNYTIE